MKKLIFVYNANSGMVNSWIDMAHKVLNPSTYECHLCSLTHGSLREKRIWKEFREAFNMPLEFYHKDEFLKKFRSKWLPVYEFPIILESDGSSLDILINSKDLNKITTPQELIVSLNAFTR